MCDRRVTPQHDTHLTPTRKSGRFVITPWKRINYLDYVGTCLDNSARKSERGRCKKIQENTRVAQDGNPPTTTADNMGLEGKFTRLIVSRIAAT